METIIAALISAAVTLLVCVVNNRLQAEKLLSLLRYRMDILERKQDSYNNVIARVFKLEETAALQAEQLASARRRIERLEDDL